MRAKITIEAEVEVGRADCEYVNVRPQDVEIFDVIRVKIAYRMQLAQKVKVVNVEAVTR